MTKEEFFKLLEEHGKGKFRIYYGDIRSHTVECYDHCPLTYLCRVIHRESYMNMEYPKAAKKLGIEHGDMNDIVDAADKANGLYRKEMLKALGLE